MPEPDYHGDEIIWRKDIRAFFRGISRHWVAFTGIFVAGSLPAYIIYLFGLTSGLSSWVFVVAAVGGLLAASFQVFRDQRRIIDRKDEQMRQLSENLASQKESHARDISIRDQLQTIAGKDKEHVQPIIAVSPPIHASKPPVADGKEARRSEIQKKLNALGDAMERLREQREDVMRAGADQYEASWTGQDHIYQVMVEFAQSKVEECFGKAESERFRSDSTFQDPSPDSKYPNYDRTFMYLRQYEARIEAYMERLSKELRAL